MRAPFSLLRPVSLQEERTKAFVAFEEERSLRIRVLLVGLSRELRAEMRGYQPADSVISVVGSALSTFRRDGARPRRRCGQLPLTRFKDRTKAPEATKDEEIILLVG